MAHDVPAQLEGLSDQELLDRESADRLEFLRLARIEPPSSGTTYRVIPTSRALLDAWRRWTKSGAAAHLRGLIPLRQDAG